MRSWELRQRVIPTHDSRQCSDIAGPRHRLVSIDPDLDGPPLPLTDTRGGESEDIPGGELIEEDSCDLRHVLGTGNPAIEPTGAIRDEGQNFLV